MIHFLNLFEMREALVVIGSVLLGCILLAGHLGEKRKNKREGDFTWKGFLFSTKILDIFFQLFYEHKGLQSKERGGDRFTYCSFYFWRMID
jgi:hypothetical protein